MGVTAGYHCRYLQEKGIYAEPWGVDNIAGLREKIAQSRLGPQDVQPLTHVCISAPFINAADMQTLCLENIPIHFSVICHSNVGFLAADTGAFHRKRDYLHVQSEVPNFRTAGNSDRLADWATSVYETACDTLPNLYYLDAVNSRDSRVPWSGDLLRIASFGAQRPLKNHVSAGAAALKVARDLRVDLEFWISGDRVEGPPIAGPLAEMFAGLKWAKICVNPWESWNRFRATVRHMDLLMQPSYTESFNVVTADGVAGGVTSVVGPSISWVPDHWQADVDDPSDLARVGKNLLKDPDAVRDGLNALTAHNEAGFRNWQRYLAETTPHR